MRANYHTHSSFCDGRSDPESFVEHALKTGVAHLGFSSHGPVDFDTDWHMRGENYTRYLGEIRRLKEKYRGRIDIYLGLEVDFFTDLGASLYEREDFDYIIGSCHFLGRMPDGTAWTVDNTPDEFDRGVAWTYGGDIRAAVSRYYRSIRMMADTLKPDIIGHLDIVKKNNRDGRFFREDAGWYREEVLATLDSLARGSCIVEVNTGGRLRNKIDDFYPSDWIIGEMGVREIPVVISSDAHAPEHLTGYFDEAEETLREAGYTGTRVLGGDGWVESPL
jgi:histidinol-phosphatase (PHP family)